MKNISNKMKHLKCYFIIISLFLVAGCNFLDEDPLSNIMSENYYQTEEDFVAATNALYDYMTVGTDYLWDPSFGGIFFNDFWVFQDLMSDNCLETIAIQDYTTMSEFKHTANNERIEYYWQDCYKTINAANVVIDRMVGVSFDEMHMSHLLAEAHFVRALMYFELVKLFGDVPLTLKETIDVESTYTERNSKEDIYAAILSDLQFAELNLSTTYRVGNGRPTNGSVEALFAKVYLTHGDYELAAQRAFEVIDSKQYSLWDDFADIFKIHNMNMGEIIFAANYSGTLSQGFKPNQYHVRLLPPGLDKNGEGPENAFGWERPTDELVNSFDPQDRRKDVTFITSFTYSDGSVETFEPHIAKFWDQAAEPRGNSTDSDVIYLRYADVLLIYAEALNEQYSGPTAEAYDAINQVRKRARFNGTVELDILPDLAGLSYDEFRDAILQERRWEFVMEGQRFNDLVRMGKLVETVEASGKANATPKEFHKLLPIPQRERNVNKKLTQNTGY